MAVPRGGAYGWPSRGNTGMAKLLGNPGILGQGGICASRPRNIDTYVFTATRKNFYNRDFR